MLTQNASSRLLLTLAVSLVPLRLAAQAAPVQTSTLADQKDVAVTVYNSNVALVRDVLSLIHI